MKLSRLLIVILLFGSLPAIAAEKVVAMRAISEAGVGKIIGIIKLADSAQGLLITPDLAELSPGERGFHIHQNPSCATLEKDGKKVAGLGAGGHYDPAHSGKHEGPAGAGHSGDLPALVVADDGTATQSVVAPKLKVANVIDRAIIIHAGSDNYSDDPKPLGGGGARIACGIIE
ncbi:MAG: superoxide dismutase [Cu-Zn] SodC2 [Betaproteobacteria bacterium HGW-Betaproteobacteria-8]|nr:MAG: superoxide dismutase [Cu-Zn] SodC2 [Betaproteobacteria bacterium HGW-Betaproteobacteria-8]